jgi:acetyl esterase/lipase
MQRRRFCSLALAAIFLFATFPAYLVAEDVAYTRQEDVVYGRKHGLALTMDVFTPKQNANGVGLVWVISASWRSSHEAIRPQFADDFLKRGYTVFAVVHGSQPRFSIPEMIEDLHRAVRFVRSRAAEHHIDPERIGIYGASAGGHLALMMATAGDKGNPEAKDLVDRQSSRVQAVACFFPPTDFLNYGRAGQVMLGRSPGSRSRPAFEFREFDNDSKSFVPITDEQKVLEIGRQISPAHHVSPDDPPVWIMHGDADPLVPLQQSELIVAKLKEAGVTAELVVKPGGAHPWLGIEKDFPLLADWFDKHLAKK